jgi:hypothetical protein
MNKVLYTILTMVCIINICSAQNISELARWSYAEPTGTARTLGVGGAFGAMGGDYSVIHINPAGIADYRRSEFIISPTIKVQKTKSYFTANTSNPTTVNKSTLGLDNVSFVIATSPSSTWTTSNFAFGFSRQSDVGRNFTVNGKTKGTITNYFAEKANGKAPDKLDDFNAYPAFSTGAIFDVDGDNNYETDFASNDVVVDKVQNVFQKGGVNEFTLGWAGEYQHKLNVGFSMGMPIFSFEENKDYTEDDITESIPVFTRLKFEEALNTTGVGFNLRGGAVFKIANRVRIGGAFHSPTWVKFTDNYNVTLTYSYNDNGDPQSYDYSSADGSFEYKMTTPWKVLGSLGTTYQLGDIKGFVDADVEYLDYTNASYNGTAYSDSPAERTRTNEINRDVQSKFGTATNLRVGTELAYQSFRVRVGYGIERTPFIADDFYNNKTSFGLGYREDNFYIDLGVRIAQYTEGYNAYTVEESSLDPLANIETNRTRANLTLGFKF